MNLCLRPTNKKNVPLGLTSVTDVAIPATAAIGPGRFPPFCRGWHTLTANTCVWPYNVTRSIAVSTGYFFPSSTFLKMAWVYPVIFAPLCLACASLAMAYNEVSVSDALWFIAHLILNVTMWVARLASERMGGGAGRSRDYRDFGCLGCFPRRLSGRLLVDWVARGILFYLCDAFPRGFSSDSRLSTPSPAAKPSAPRIGTPPTDQRAVGLRGNIGFRHRVE